MEVSKIQQIFALEWLQLQTDEVRIFSLVPRGERNNANAHGYIMEQANGSWRCAAIDSSGEMTELGIQPRRIDARQMVQKHIIQTNRYLAEIEAQKLAGEEIIERLAQ